MSREKQIDEIAKLICSYPQCVNYNVIGGCKVGECRIADNAENVYNAGFRKQSVGEWIWTENGTEDYEQYWLCSCCNNKSYWKSKFCEECGAKMKGESE